MSFDENGNTVVTATGFNALTDPSVGLLLLIGEWNLVFDPNGNLIQAQTGTGRITDICELISN